MDELVDKHIHDILSVIEEIDMAVERFGRNYETFTSDVVYRKFIERNIEIIGEATNRILKVNPNINISSSRKIVDTRNYVIHAYDTLKPEILWAIVINHIPRLKEELLLLINSK